MPTAEKEMTPEAIQLRLAEVAPEQRAAELIKIAEEMGLKHTPNDKDPSIELSEATLQRLFSGSKEEAAKVVKEEAATAERKYDLNPGTALAAADSAVAKALRNRDLKRTEDLLIGKRFASIIRAQNGIDRKGDYGRYLEEEVNHVRKHYGVEHRAMSLSDDTTGGYLAPEVWETRVYQSLKKTNVARRYCTLIEMTGTEIKRFPKLTAGLTAYTRSEGVGATTSQITTAQFTLQPKSITVLTAPFSIELLETADPNLIELLTQQGVLSFGRKEDEALWVGSDSQFTGLMEQTTNNVILGGSSTSGKTAITNITFDDLFDLENELDEQYTPDADTENSGGLPGAANYWFNKNAYNALRKLKGDDQYYMDVSTMIRDREIQGYKFKRISDLPSAPATNTRFGVFGNLAYVWMGHRPGIRTDMLKEGMVGGVNLGTTGQYAMRWIEFVDFATVDDEALSIMKTATT